MKTITKKGGKRPGMARKNGQEQDVVLELGLGLEGHSILANGL